MSRLTQSLVLDFLATQENHTSDSLIIQRHFDKKPINVSPLLQRMDKAGLIWRNTSVRPVKIGLPEKSAREPEQDSDSVKDVETPIDSPELSESHSLRPHLFEEDHTIGLPKAKEDIDEESVNLSSDARIVPESSSVPSIALNFFFRIWPSQEKVLDYVKNYQGLNRGILLYQRWLLKYNKTNELLSAYNLFTELVREEIHNLSTS